MTIDEYILSHSDEEGALLSALNRDANVNLLRPRMLSGHLQGRILKMFCRMLRPRRVLEIGTYTGYATLCMAEGLEEGALIHTLEINDEMEDFIMKYLRQSPHQDKVRVHFGDALDIIPALGETFDLVFDRCRQAALLGILRPCFPDGACRWIDSCRQYVVGRSCGRRASHG